MTEEHDLARRCRLYLSPLAGRGRREAPGEGAYPRVLSLWKRPLTRLSSLRSKVDLSRKRGVKYGVVMTVKSVAILGAGHGGFAAAADLTSRGY